MVDLAILTISAKRVIFANSKCQYNPIVCVSHAAVVASIHLRVRAHVHAHTADRVHDSCRVHRLASVAVEHAIHPLKLDCLQVRVRALADVHGLTPSVVHVVTSDVRHPRVPVIAAIESVAG
jgi:hypothetical protein